MSQTNVDMKNIQNKRPKNRHGHNKTKSHDIDSMFNARKGMIDYDATAPNFKTKASEICIV